MVDIHPRAAAQVHLWSFTELCHILAFLFVLLPCIIKNNKIHQCSCITCTVYILSRAGNTETLLCKAAYQGYNTSYELECVVKFYVCSKNNTDHQFTLLQVILVQYYTLRFNAFQFKLHLQYNLIKTWA